MEGSNSPQIFTVLQGMGARSEHLENGGRQVIGFLCPGDFLGRQTVVTGETKHMAVAFTRMRLCVFNRADLRPVFRSHPERPMA